MDVVLIHLFDNNLAPWFGALVVLWATVVFETWKRSQATWAHKWDVGTFENQERVRAQFQGV